MIRHIILTTALFFHAAGTHAKDADDYRIASITSQLMLLQGKGGNIALQHGDDGILLVDSDYPERSEALLGRIEQLHRGKPLRYLINTHWHPDRTGLNSLLGQSTTIIAHENVRLRLASQQSWGQPERLIGPMATAGWPDITYQQAIDLYFNGDRITITHYPGGHTDGDSVVHFIGQNVVHTGDLYVRDEFPAVDLLAGGNAIQLARNVAALQATLDAETLIIPGRGELSNQIELARYTDMLESSIDSVRKLKILGMSLKQVQQHGLDPKWASWGKGQVDEKTWIEWVYLSL